ncbi:hypothetical protein K437DRAFT_256088 [Tilletiaria anomala UBC 951]|uniref:Uncharacterized protein n=1 Tax=Tilletiaria anomala (strain ATCC 24038 / CBS 436.72 / UBC 951) TaxID=1037660 RepID=A0A066W2P6_TILAU|nr:uncharacterized protein K437DRAFT_256088 [Tilletiaria anomala UBC 951]KDN46813.1 hypothetical protein K437DRAFT_256088 [Tilletiaria anomala UBC 951]
MSRGETPGPHVAPSIAHRQGRRSTTYLTLSNVYAARSVGSRARITGAPKRASLFLAFTQTNLFSWPQSLGHEQTNELPTDRTQEQIFISEEPHQVRHAVATGSLRDATRHKQALDDPRPFRPLFCSIASTRSQSFRSSCHLRPCLGGTT